MKNLIGTLVSMAVALAILLPALAMTGCQTTRTYTTPDGTEVTETSTDVEATLAIMQASMTIMEQALAMYQAMHPPEDRSVAEAAQIARQQQMIDLARQAIEAYIEAHKAELEVSGVDAVAATAAQ